MTHTYNRRTILASLGAVGAVVFGSQAVRGRDPPYTQYTYAQTGETGLRLSVAWYETYNGAFVEATDQSSETNATLVTDPGQAPFYVANASGPLLTLDNVLPGDSGSLLIGLLAEQVPTEIEGMDVWFRPILTANLENEVTEPESVAGDEDDPGDGSSVGELADALQVQFFMDDGLIGGCDGNFWIDDTPLSQNAPLSTVFPQLGDGISLTDGGCLQDGQRQCLGLTWNLPEGTTNAVQTDSLSFDLEFIGVACGGSNPFGGSQ